MTRLKADDVPLSDKKMQIFIVAGFLGRMLGGEAVGGVIATVTVAYYHSPSEEKMARSSWSGYVHHVDQTSNIIADIN